MAEYWSTEVSIDLADHIKASLTNITTLEISVNGHIISSYLIQADSKPVILEFESLEATATYSDPHLTTPQ